LFGIRKKIYDLQLFLPLPLQEEEDSPCPSALVMVFSAPQDGHFFGLHLDSFVAPH
jgi:hypothetical protein